jgi:hypothetical protein
MGLFLRPTYKNLKKRNDIISNVNLWISEKKSYIFNIRLVQIFGGINMKIGTDFVSNSSSIGFTLFGIRMDFYDFFEWVQERYCEIWEEIIGTVPDNTENDIDDNKYADAYDEYYDKLADIIIAVNKKLKINYEVDWENEYVYFGGIIQDMKNNETREQFQDRITESLKPFNKNPGWMNIIMEDN